MHDCRPDVSVTVSASMGGWQRQGWRHLWQGAKLFAIFHRQAMLLACLPCGLLNVHHTPVSGSPPIPQIYYEAKVTDEGLCRVGWATRAAALELGTDRQGFGFGGTGKKSFGKSFEDYGQKFGTLPASMCHCNLRT